MSGIWEVLGSREGQEKQSVLELCVYVRARECVSMCVSV